jgi:hypothetical protein
MNTSQRLDALDKEYDRALRNLQTLMDATQDPKRQYQITTIGNRMHIVYEELKDKILSGKPL